MPHLKGYGWVKVFKTVGTNGDFDYGAASKLDMTIEQAALEGRLQIVGLAKAGLTDTQVARRTGWSKHTAGS